jgi:ketosteroid isomerase-like protein
MKISLKRSLTEKITGLILLVILTVSSSSTFAQNPEQEKIHKVVNDFFQALAALSDQGIRDVVEPDFVLLEDGEVWNTDTLTNALTPMKTKKFSRINRLKFLTSEQAGDVAWVTYDNEADITVDGKSYKRHWLESAVLKRTNGVWRISMLHSTVIRKK